MNWWSMQNWLSEGKLHVGSLIQTLNEFFICDYLIFFTFSVMQHFYLVK